MFRIWYDRTRRIFLQYYHGNRSPANHVRDVATVTCLFYVILLLIEGTGKVEQVPTDPHYRLYHAERDAIETYHGELAPSKVYNASNYILKPDCSDTSYDTVVIFVHSHLANIGRRAAIRATWGNTSHYGNATYGINVTVVFSVGFNDDSEPEHTPDRELLIEIKAESTVHRDVLFLDMVDTYDNLAYKSLLTMQWINESCPRTKHIFKTDDDVLLNTFGWLQVVDELRNRELSCGIVCNAWMSPLVARDGKYAVTRAEYSADQYPDFCSGAGYMMTRDAMAAILEVASYVSILKRDDPYFTGVLTMSTDVALITVESGSYLYTERERISSDDRPVMVMHDPTPIQWGYGWEGFISRHEHPVLRSKLAIYTFPKNHSSFLPGPYMLPFNAPLKSQCARPRDIQFEIDV